jgi:protein-S-isoprenylcysteine O-methyltransferase Ste14
MALIDSFERQGNFLFRNRSYIPVVLYVISIPVVYFTPVKALSDSCISWVTYSAIALSMAGFLIRMRAIGTTPRGTSGRNTNEQVAESLNTKGIYSTVRHPLYLGNYLMWLGIMIFTFNAWFVLAVSLAFWIYYERIMYAEERFLEKKFGQVYLSWASTVPAFIPGMKNYTPSETPFSIISVLRREYSGFLATVLSFTFIDYLRAFASESSFEQLRLSGIFLGIAVVITLILRTLKHSTHLLDEEGRS